MNDEPSIVKEMREQDNCKLENPINSHEENIQQNGEETNEAEINESSVSISNHDSETEVYKKLVENLLEGIVILDFKGNVLYANPAMAHLFGFDSTEEAANKNALDFIDPKYRKRVIRDQLLVRFGKGGFLSTYQGIKKNGEKIWIEGLGCKIKYDNKSANVVFIRDITPRRKTWEKLINLEKKYRAIAEMSADGIITIDPLGKLTYSNPSFQKMVDPSNEKLSSGLFRDFLSDDTVYLFQQIFMESRKKDKKIEHVELELLDNNDEIIPIELSISPLKTNESFTGFVCTIHDVIERKQMEQEIKKSEQLKTEFMNIAAHELKSPVTPIKGYLDLIISDAETNQQTKKWATVSLRNAERLLLLVNDILDVSRLDSDTMKFEMRKMSSEKLLKDIAEDLKPSIEQKNLQLHVDIPENLPPILGDEHRLTQVIRNLIVNAVKFTDKGSISLSGKVIEDRLIISVEDTGVGIKKEDLTKIFQKFYQADTADSRKHEGTGLGLFICKQIMKKHQGDITVESEPGKGSCFTLTIPVITH
ncbi:MAG: PAS domain-containing sensor histidine kinase [Thermoplasmatota archaeon]